MKRGVTGAAMLAAGLAMASGAEAAVTKPALQIDFPCQTNGAKSDGHGVINMSCSTGDGAYAVTMQALDGSTPDDSAYGTTVEAIAKEAGGKLRSDTPVTVDGVAGREAILDIADSKMVARVRLFAANGVLITANYAGPAGTERGAVAEAFFASFRPKP